MPDVLSSGPDDEREPYAPDRRPPRWLTVLGVAAALGAAATVAARTGPPGGPTPRPAVTPSPAYTIPLSVEPEPEPSLEGTPGPAPSGLRVVVDGARVVLVSGTSAEVTVLPGIRLSAGQTAQVQRVPGGLLAVVGNSESALRDVWLLPAGGVARRLGRSGEVLPAVGGGYLAVTYDSPGSSLSGWAPDGTVRWQRRHPRGATWVVRDTPYGMLQLYDPRPDTGGDGALSLVDPRTGAVRRVLGTASTLVASDDRAVAWTAGGCLESCPLLVTDLRTGSTRQYPAPRTTPWAYGSFSPDRRSLLLGVLGEHAPDGPGDPGFAAVLDLASGRVLRVPGVATPAKRGPDAAWVDDATVVVGVDFSDHERFALWRLGDARLTLLPARVDGEPGGQRLTVLPA